MRRPGAPFYLKATSLPSAPHVCCVLCGACCALFAVCYVVFGVAVVVVAVVVLIFTLLGVLVTFGSLWGALGASLATLGPWKMKRGPLWSAKPRVSFSERKARVGSEIIPD